MTCIVGLKDGNRLLIGGDSAASAVDGPEIFTFTMPKVFAIGEYLAGFAVSFRAGQLLRHEVEWPSPPAGADLEPFLVRELIPRVREVFRGGGFTQDEDGAEKGSKFLVGLRGRLFTVASDFSVCETIDSFQAIGSGGLAACGAMHVLAGLDLPPEEKVERALAAAEHFTASVRSPFVVLSSPRTEPKGKKAGRGRSR